MIGLTWLIYVAIAYITWFCVSRLAVLGAWLYSKPQTLTARHYTVLVLALLPIGFEVISSVLVIFAIAFGIDPHDRK
jgi:hypothetical protein